MAASIMPISGTETIAELQAIGMSEATAHVARRRGYWCPGYNRRAYPQLDGPGGFADLYDPRGFVINHLAQALRKAGAHLDPDEFRDWVQDLLLECWRRRHAPHVAKFVPYYMVMIRGLVRQWLKRRARHESLGSGTPSHMRD